MRVKNEKEGVIMTNRKITDKEIENFVKELDETNNMVWNAICYTEQLLSNKVFQEFQHTTDEERNAILNRIARHWHKTEKHLDDGFAQPELNGSYFSDFEQLGQDLQNALDKIV